MRKKKKVRAELMDSVMDYLLAVYGGLGVPSKTSKYSCFHCNIYMSLELAVMRDVSTIMGFNYPNMFQDKGEHGILKKIFSIFLVGLFLGKLGYGLGGVHGNKSLPDHLVVRVSIVDLIV